MEGLAGSVRLASMRASSRPRGIAHGRHARSPGLGHAPALAATDAGRPGRGRKAGVRQWQGKEQPRSLSLADAALRQLPRTHRADRDAALPGAFRRRAQARLGPPHLLRSRDRRRAPADAARANHRRAALRPVQGPQPDDAAAASAACRSPTRMPSCSASARAARTWFTSSTAASSRARPSATSRWPTSASSSFRRWRTTAACSACSCRRAPSRASRSARRSAKC